MSKTFSKKIDKNFDCQFFLDFFVLSRFWVFLSDGSSKTLQNKSSKSLYKKFDQKSKTEFFSNFSYHVFGRFSVRGVKKHDKKYRKNKSDPIPFSYSDPPTTGVTDFCFCRPLAAWFLVACARVSTDGTEVI
jgi:hypothetical protein